MKKSTLLIFVYLNCFVVGNMFAANYGKQPDSKANSANPPCLLYVNEVGHVDVNCNGASTGSIDITPVDGTAPYSFAWSNGATTEDISGLVAGLYTVTVTDNGGCSYEYTTQIFENPAIVVGKTVTSASCFGNQDGSALLAVSGGVGPYTYVWSNGGTDFSASNLAAGNYSVTITDNVGCSKVESILITQPNQINGTISVTNASCYG